MEVFLILLGQISFLFSPYCASEGAFSFSFVSVMYLNIAFYLYANKVKCAE